MQQGPLGQQRIGRVETVDAARDDGQAHRLGLRRQGAGEEQHAGVVALDRLARRRAISSSGPTPRRRRPRDGPTAVMWTMVPGSTPSAGSASTSATQSSARAGLTSKRAARKAPEALAEGDRHDAAGTPPARPRAAAGQRVAVADDDHGRRHRCRRERRRHGAPPRRRREPLVDERALAQHALRRGPCRCRRRRARPSSAGARTGRSAAAPAGAPRRRSRAAGSSSTPASHARPTAARAKATSDAASFGWRSVGATAAGGVGACRARPASVRPGPTSSSTRLASARIVSMPSRKRTALRRWRTQYSGSVDVGGGDPRAGEVRDVRDRRRRRTDRATAERAELGEDRLEHRRVGGDVDVDAGGVDVAARPASPPAPRRAPRVPTRRTARRR